MSMENKSPAVFIIHGIEGRAGIHWQQWLHDKLVEEGVEVVMPTLPNPDHPDRNSCREFVKGLLGARREAIFVGHSLGVATVLDVIEDMDIKVPGLFSVSGFSSDYGAPLNSYFMGEREIDFAKILPKVARSFVFYGDNDPYVPQATLKELGEKLHAETFPVAKGGHLNTSAGFTEFPQLLYAVQEVL